MIFYRANTNQDLKGETLFINADNIVYLKHHEDKGVTEIRYMTYQLAVAYTSEHPEMIREELRDN